MSRRYHRKGKRYTVEAQRAKDQDVEVEIKEVVEEKDDDMESVLFQFTFTNGRKFSVTVNLEECKYDEYIYLQQYYYWKNFKKGDKVIAVVCAQKIVNIY